MTSHESVILGNFQKNGKIPLFFKKIRDFSAILRFIARDYRDFFGCFFARDFRDFFALKSGFSRKIIWEHWFCNCFHFVFIFCYF